MSAASTTDVLDVIDHLPGTLRTVRTLRGKSLRQVAAETGESFATISRVENGHDCLLSSARALIAWIANGSDVTPVISEPQP